MKGWCEKCQQLVGISPTGKTIVKGGREYKGLLYWRLDVHKIKDAEQLCPASGDDV